MNILGLNIGHNSTACLLNNGKIVGCISEERFSRIKNHYGVPYKSIEYLLKTNKLSIQDIDNVVLDDQYSLKYNPSFGTHFLEAYTKKSLVKKILSTLGYSYPKIFASYMGLKDFFLSQNKKSKTNTLKNKLSELIKISPDKIIVIDHHLAHALSTCYNIPKDKKTLIFTLDGEGSGICASVNIFDGKNLRIIARSKKSASLGYLYALATLFLGMKPMEHEFKVMGLAPYAKTHKVDEIYHKFKELIYIDSQLCFQSKFNMPFADHFFIREMKYVRFDIVAGAVQRLVEELTSEWIKKAIVKTGISDITLSGGVFMNVKANQKIAEMPEVKNIFVMPSCGDEANALGACFYGYKKYCEENNLSLSSQPLKDLYLGPEYMDTYIEELIKTKSLHKKYTIKKVQNINREVARLLAKGHIVARCSGRSEWGARALGNRSILSNASNPDTIRILNETIKDRDFWMPFTPSILDKYERKYVVNPKKIFAPYMAITFDSTKKARKDIPAAMHPYDQTLRPQIVTKEYNSDYYEIIKEYNKLTGAGGILNTSFNLHGEPNVLTPEDAIHTVEKSDLKYLAMGNYLFRKISANKKFINHKVGSEL